MRAVLPLVIVLSGFCWIAGTQELKSDEKAPPTDKEIIDLVGSRMSKVFAKFGYPQDLVPTDVSSDDPEVMLDYGSYGFKIQDKVLDCCIFFSNWKGTVYGASIGDPQDEVVKKLGQPTSSDKDSDGLPYLVWNFKDQEGYLMINFDKDNKMNRAVVNAE
jgi:hypothetical protein